MLDFNDCKAFLLDRIVDVVTMRVCQLCVLNFAIRSLPVTSTFRFNSRRDIFEPISSGRNFSCFRYRDSLPDIISINYNLIHSWHALAKARKVKDTIETKFADLSKFQFHQRADSFLLDCTRCLEDK